MGFLELLLYILLYQEVDLLVRWNDVALWALKETVASSIQVISANPIGSQLLSLHPLIMFEPLDQLEAQDRSRAAAARSHLIALTKYPECSPVNDLPSSIRPGSTFQRGLIVVGDSCGKVYSSHTLKENFTNSVQSSLIKKFMSGGFPQVSIRSILFVYFPADMRKKSPAIPSDVEIADIEVGGILVQLSIWDTLWYKSFDQLRELCHLSHVALICYGIDDPDSLENVRDRVRNQKKILSIVR